jgi:hypothetical protein
LRSTLNPEKVEEMRRIWIYFGPVLLASVIGNAAYGGLFATTMVSIGGLPVFVDAMLALAGAVIAWRMTDTLGRIAWTIFTLYQGMQTLTRLHGTRLSSVWSLGLIGLFAVLATGSAARTASRRTLLMAVAVFVVVLITVVAVRYYADAQLGNHSVIG